MIPGRRGLYQQSGSDCGEGFRPTRGKKKKNQGTRGVRCRSELPSMSILGCEIWDGARCCWLLAAVSGLGTAAPRALPLHNSDVRRTLHRVRSSKAPHLEKSVSSPLNMIRGSRRRSSRDSAGIGGEKVDEGGNSVDEGIELFFSPQGLREKYGSTQRLPSALEELWASSSSTSHSAVAVALHPPLLRRCPAATSLVDTNQLLITVAPGGLGGWVRGGVVGQVVFHVTARSSFCQAVA